MAKEIPILGQAGDEPPEIADNLAQQTAGTGERPQPDQAGATGASDVSPSETQGADNQQRTKPEDYEKRWKDTQRALSERETSLKQMQAQVELLTKLVGNPAQEKQAQQVSAQMKERIEQLKRESITDPGVLVDYFNEMLQGQHQYIQQLQSQIREEMEAKMLSQSPDYAEMQEAMQALDQEGFADMPLAMKARIAGAMRKHYVAKNGTGTPVLNPPGAVGSRRAATDVRKPTNKREQFASFLKASGAVTSGDEKGIIKFAMGE